MLSNFLKKHSLILLVGIPIILLLIFSVFSNSEDEIEQGDFVKYYNELPQKYTAIFNKIKKDSTNFFCTILEEYGNRELIIFKKAPVNQLLKTDFIITVFPETDNYLSKPLRLNLVNDAVIFNYENVTYGYHRISLPFINTEKLEVKRKVLNKHQKKWDTLIQTPFKTTLKPDIYIGESKGFDKLSNPYFSLFTDLLKLRGIRFLPYSYVFKNDSLYQTKPEVEKYFLEEKLTLGKIQKPVLFWEALNAKNKNLLELIQFSGENKGQAMTLIQDLITEEKEISEVFNLEKTAQYFAIKDLFISRCNEYVYFLYNSTNKLLEPYFVHSECLGKVSDFIEKPLIHDINFIDFYLSELDKLTNLDIKTDLLNNNTTFEEELSFINSYHPDLIFDIDVLNINQRIIFQNINDTQAIKPEVISVDKNKMILSILNLSKYPVNIIGLNHEKKKSITLLNSNKQILSGKKDTIIINLPRSFENLFVSKKTKEVGFKLYKHIYDLYISYSIVGINNTLYSSILPYQEKEEVTQDIFRDSINISDRNDIVIYNKKNIITFKEKNITISTPLIIPNNHTFVIKEGTIIDVVEGGKIISHSPIKFNGTKENPIVIRSSDKKGQGILVLSEDQPNIVNYTIFDYLTNLEHGFWNVTGAVTFYESPVTLNNVTVSNNRCEDALNIIRTTFEMRNCTLSNTQSDAFDGDFVVGTIKDSKFINLGNDAIDVSGSDINIFNVQISEAGDKGLSAGEDSKMTVKNVYISTSEIAVAGKDLSVINIDKLFIENTKLAFTAFQKKPEFGPSNITAIDVKMENVEIKYLVESTSSLLMEGVKVETSQNVKDRMYGAEFGISSDETRNKQYNN